MVAYDCYDDQPDYFTAEPPPYEAGQWPYTAPWWQAAVRKVYDESKGLFEIEQMCGAEIATLIPGFLASVLRLPELRAKLDDEYVAQAADLPEQSG